MTHATVEAGFWAELARVHWLGSFGGGAYLHNATQVLVVGVAGDAVLLVG